MPSWFAEPYQALNQTLIRFPYFTQIGGMNSKTDSLEELALELSDYIHWYNHIRIHGTLGYVSPIQYKLDNLKKIV
jgi:transposase InsO family protein